MIRISDAKMDEASREKNAADIFRRALGFPSLAPTLDGANFAYRFIVDAFSQPEFIVTLWRRDDGWRASIRSARISIAQYITDGVDPQRVHEWLASKLLPPGIWEVRLDHVVLPDVTESPTDFGLLWRSTDAIVLDGRSVHVGVNNAGESAEFRNSTAWPPDAEQILTDVLAALATRSPDAAAIIDPS